MSESGSNRQDDAFTVKEIVVDILDTVKELAAHIDRIDRDGSIGTRSLLDDHEQRLRLNNDRLQRLEDTQVTRADMHDIKASVNGLALSLTERTEQIRHFHEAITRIDDLEGDVHTLKLWHAWTKGLAALAVFLAPILAASWHWWS